MSEFKTSSASESDPGVFSLSQIMHVMRVEFSRAQRYGYPLTCLLIGVDRLGQLRDLYGYDSKEAIVDEIIALLRQETRTCDFLGRMMNDRLLAVVPHTGAEGARVLAERLLAGVRGLHFESDGRQIPITIAIGAAHNAEGKTLFFDDIVSAAEGALTEAIAGGGDRFLMRDPGAAVR